MPDPLHILDEQVDRLGGPVGTAAGGMPGEDLGLEATKPCTWGTFGMGSTSPPQQGPGPRVRVTLTVTAMLAAMEACAHATHGDTPRCLKALSEAERALGRSNPAEDPGWVDFDEGGWLATSRGPCGTSPGPSEAERFATRSIEVCHPQHRRTRMQRYAILATTHVQQGDLEGACAVGRQVLEEARGPNSTRTLDDVTRLVQLVSASSPSAPALEFTEQARALLKPGRRRPPPASRS